MKFTSTKVLQSLILTGLFLFTCVGCGSGTSATTSSTTTQPTQPSAPTTPAVPAGWTNLVRTYFSFGYPSGYTLTDTTYGGQPLVFAKDPAQQHQVMLQFVPGFPNKSSTFDQCADADQYLNDFYTAAFLPLAKEPGYSVTWLSLPTIGGLLGGSVGTVSVGYEIKPGSSVNYTVDLQAVPRAEGLYLVGIWNPDYYATPSFEKTFLSTLVFLKSNPLPYGSNCSYLNEAYRS